MNPLTDVLPAKARKIAYAVVFVLAILFAAWQSAHGDVLAAVGGVITALTTALAGSNTHTEARDGAL